MNLKQRFSLIFSLVFSFVLASLLLLVLTLFSNFRKEEIQARLVEKAKTTVQLLIEVKAVDYTLLKLIDKNTINNLYNEKTLVFNDSFALIYSSIDDAVINWDSTTLNKINKDGYLYRTDREYDIVGIKTRQGGKNYLVLISAEDKFGKRNLDFLKYLIIIVFFVGVVMVWALSFYFSKRALLPLDVFKDEVQNISENNLSIRLKDTGRRDEISALTTAFNIMIERIDKSFRYQKSFVGNASHELRTPLTKISAQLENLVQKPDVPLPVKAALESIKEDTSQLSDIITSLLILSKLESENNTKSFMPVRIDEIIFDSIEFVKKYQPDLKIQFEIVNESNSETRLDIQGDESLLKIAIINLIKNASLYSSDRKVEIKLVQRQNGIGLSFVNNGITPNANDTQELFNPFVRGSNAAAGKGFGLGLSIVKRIVQYHNAEITYRIPAPEVNELNLFFRF